MSVSRYAHSDRDLDLRPGRDHLHGAALPARRYETAVVSQQTMILGNMKDLNDELRETAQALRSERDSLRAEVMRLSTQVDELTVELRVANAALSGQVSRIQSTLDEPHGA